MNHGNAAPHRLPALPSHGGMGPDRQGEDIGGRAAALLHPAARAARADRHGDRDEDVRPRLGSGARLPRARRSRFSRPAPRRIFAIVGSIFVARRDLRRSSRRCSAARATIVAALKVATYGAIPVMLAGATLLLPVMAIVAIVGRLPHAFPALDRRAARAERSARRAGRVRGHLVVLLTFVSVLAGAAASAIGRPYHSDPLADATGLRTSGDKKGPHRCGPFPITRTAGDHVPTVTIVSPVRFGYRTCSTSS